MKTVILLSWLLSIWMLLNARYQRDSGLNFQKGWVIWGASRLGCPRWDRFKEAWFCGAVNVHHLLKSRLLNRFFKPSTSILMHIQTLITYEYLDFSSPLKGCLVTVAVYPFGTQAAASSIHKRADSALKSLVTMLSCAYQAQSKLEQYGSPSCPWKCQEAAYFQQG